MGDRNARMKSKLVVGGPTKHCQVDDLESHRETDERKKQRKGGHRYGAIAEGGIAYTWAEEGQQKN